MPATRCTRKPATPDLAREFGNVNFVKGIARGRDVETDIGRFALEDVASIPDLRDGARLLVLIRPEQIRAQREGHRARRAPTCWISSSMDTTPW